MRYSPKALHYFETLIQAGEFSSDIGRVFTGKICNQESIQLQLQIDEEGRIMETRFKVYGSVATIAVIAYLAEQLIDQTVSQAQEVHPQPLLEALELPPLKLPSAVLAHSALDAALKEYLSFDQTSL